MQVRGSTAARAVSFVGLLAMSTAVLSAQPGLTEILEIGMSPAHGNLRWGASRSEVQRLLSSESEDAKVSDSGCVYKVYLNGTPQPDRLTSIRLEQTEGAPEKCRARVQQLLEGMFGAASTVEHESGWSLVTSDATFSGPMVQSSWQTQTTCINLSWKEGSGFPGSPLIVTLGDQSQACGYDDQIVPIRRVAGAVAPAGDANISVETLQKSMMADGPAQTLKTYFECSRPEGYRLIQSGDRRAIDLAAKLLDSSDGCDTEMLLSSLAIAIQKNPEAVLSHMSAVLGGHADPLTFCVPFIAEDVSATDALAILARSEQSLLKVKRPDVQKARQTCLDAIRKSRHSLLVNAKTAYRVSRRHPAIGRSHAADLACSRISPEPDRRGGSARTAA